MSRVHNKVFAYLCRHRKVIICCLLASALTLLTGSMILSRKLQNASTCQVDFAHSLGAGAVQENLQRQRQLQLFKKLTGISGGFLLLTAVGVFFLPER